MKADVKFDYNLEIVAVVQTQQVNKLYFIFVLHNTTDLAVLDGNIFAVGGISGISVTNGKRTNPMARYDSSTNTWQLIETWELLLAFYNAPIVIALDGWLYFIGMSHVYTPAGSVCWVSSDCFSM